MHPLKEGIKSFPTPIPVSGVSEEVDDPDALEDSDEVGEEGSSLFEIKRVPGIISKSMRKRVIDVGGKNILVFEIPKRRR